jgi:peptidoglycan/LPS O-acetylase OafA/YrhL
MPIPSLSMHGPMMQETLLPHASGKAPIDHIPHLDGIRGLALVGVLLFHFEMLGATGGFAGVDVFLVLSGFLMTRIISRRVEERSFSMIEFCKRRFWRLYPAALTVTAATLVLAYLLSTPDEAISVSQSAVSSMAFSSNLYFLSETGYWDASSQTKPLLHTWSLSLEEQFYFIWPLFVLAASTNFLTSPGQQPARKSLLYPSIALVSLFSFSINIYLLQHFPSTAFYALPARVFEFGVGAYCVSLYPTGGLRHLRLFRELMAVCGLLGVVGSFFFLSSGAAFPGINALPAILGTAALILGVDTCTATAFLASKPMKIMGRYSYTAYLVHWPLWVFGIKLRRGFALIGKPSSSYMILLTFVLAYGLHRCVEDPMRLRNRKPLFFVGLCILLTASFAITGISYDGWKFRSPQMSPANCARADPRAVFGLARTPGAIPRNCILSEKPFSNNVKAVVVGNSFASHLLKGLERIASENGVTIVVLHMGGCPLNVPSNSSFSNEFLMKDVAAMPVVVGAPSFQRRCSIENILRWSLLKSIAHNQSVVIASHFRDEIENVENLSNIARVIRNLGHKPMFLVPPPRLLPNSITAACAESNSLPFYKLSRFLWPGGSRCPSTDRPDALSVRSSGIVREAAKISSSKSIDLFEACCGQEATRCTTVQNGTALFRPDGIHLSHAGALHFSSIIENAM